jgi:phosphoenolpyruvate carboxylase
MVERNLAREIANILSSLEGKGFSDSDNAYLILQSVIAREWSGKMELSNLENGLNRMGIRLTEIMKRAVEFGSSDLLDLQTSFNGLKTDLEEIKQSLKSSRNELIIKRRLKLVIDIIDAYLQALQSNIRIENPKKNPLIKDAIKYGRQAASNYAVLEPVPEYD